MFFGWSPGGSLFGLLFMLLFWGLSIWGISAFFRSFSRGTLVNLSGSDPALDLLRERYARGEISDEEYALRKRVLKEQEEHQR